MEAKFSTVTECCKQNPAHAKLIRAVIKQFGGMNSDTQQMMQDVLEHGIDGGFHGFIYYSDTVIFAQKNQKAIVALLEEQAEQLGEGDVISMVNCFKPFRKKRYGRGRQKEPLFVLSRTGRTMQRNNNSKRFGMVRSGRSLPYVLTGVLT